MTHSTTIHPNATFTEPVDPAWVRPLGTLDDDTDQALWLVKIPADGSIVVVDEDGAHTASGPATVTAVFDPTQAGAGQVIVNKVDDAVAAERAERQARIRSDVYALTRLGISSQTARGIVRAANRDPDRVPLTAEQIEERRTVRAAEREAAQAARGKAKIERELAKAADQAERDRAKAERDAAKAARQAARKGNEGTTP